MTPRTSLLLLGLACAVAAPVAAQDMGRSYTFLKAVRDRDANAAQPIISDPSSTVVNTRDDSGTAALHILVRRRDGEWLGWLLSNRARPDIQDGDGNTPLALAAQIGWFDGATMLLARGAQVDVANRRGETPLILAVQARQLPIGDRMTMARLLLGRGADPRRQDSSAGYSAIDYARQDGRSPDLVRLLEETRPRQQPQMVGPSLN